MGKTSNIFNNCETDFSIKIYRLEELADTIFEEYQRYDFHQVIWLTQSDGDRCYTIDFKDYIVGDNEITIIFPRQIEKINLSQKAGFLFAIHNDIFFEINQILQSDYLNGYLSNIFITPDTHTTKTLYQIVDLLLDEYNNENRRPLLKTYLQSFLYLISINRTDSISINDQKELLLFIDFLKLLDYEYIRNKDVSFYTNQLNITEKKLNRICKDFSGTTTKQMIQDRIILEIKKEIKIGSKTLKEIAFHLNFNEYAYFTRFFKQQTSITPSQFKLDK